MPEVPSEGCDVALIGAGNALVPESRGQVHRNGRTDAGTGGPGGVKAMAPADTPPVCGALRWHGRPTSRLLVGLLQPCRAI